MNGIADKKVKASSRSKEAIRCIGGLQLGKVEAVRSTMQHTVGDKVKPHCPSISQITGVCAAVIHIRIIPSAHFYMLENHSHTGLENLGFAEWVMRLWLVEKAAAQLSNPSALMFPVSLFRPLIQQAKRRLPSFGSQEQRCLAPTRDPSRGND
jgi:hypothetical protein